MRVIDATVGAWDAEKYVDPYDGKQDPSEYGLYAIDDEITENTKNYLIIKYKRKS